MLKKIKITAALCFLLLFLAGTSVNADIYRYVDENGRVHFTNVPKESKYRFYRNEGDRLRLESLISHWAQQFDLDKALIKAVIKVESDFDAQVVSHKGAQGLMQLMPGTARELGVDNPFNPADSIYGGSFYLRKMLDAFGSNLDLALAAYNAGPTTVRKYGGIPPYAETRNYVKRVRYYLNYYRRTQNTF